MFQIGIDVNRVKGQSKQNSIKGEELLRWSLWSNKHTLLSNKINEERVSKWDLPSWYVDYYDG